MRERGKMRPKRTTQESLSSFRLCFRFHLINSAFDDIDTFGFIVSQPAIEIIGHSNYRPFSFRLSFPCNFLPLPDPSFGRSNRSISFVAVNGREKKLIGLDS